MPPRPRLGLGTAAACATLGGGIAVWYGCSVYGPSLLLPADAGIDGGSGDDAPTPEGGEAGPGPCALFHPPPRPAADDPSSNQNVQIVLAVRTIDMGVRLDGGAPPVLGYDLDQVDTCCMAGPESCKPRASGAVHCDEEGGRDDSTAGLVYDLSVVSNGQFNQDEINSYLNQGFYGYLARVRQYNGQPNDTQVELSVYTSNGTLTPDGGKVLPQWKGNDVWSLDPGSVFSNDGGGGVIPVYADVNAYVSGGMLVGSMDFPITLGGTGGTSEVTLHLSEGMLSGQLVPKGTSYEFQNGLITGRSAVPDLLNEMQGFNDPINGGYLCQGTSTYETVKMLICQRADIALHITEDNTGALCDAVSVAIALTGYPARFGATVPKSGVPKGCPDAALDDCN
jgi:hypothetical protein